MESVITFLTVHWTSILAVLTAVWTLIQEIRKANK